MTYPYDCRYIVRIVAEAETPLAVGTGEKDLLTDSPICVDMNDLPMIPGTGLAGVLRHLFAAQDSQLADQLFGYQRDNNEDGAGSRLIVSNAYLLDDKYSVIEGMVNKKRLESDYLKELALLPVRQHCRINHRGVSDQEEHGKFDGQVVPKGVRFVFEMELIGTKEDETSWNQLLNLLSNPFFRIGGGTRKGFGKLKIILEDSQYNCFNLRDAKDRNEYLNRSSSLCYPLQGTSLQRSEAEKKGTSLQRSEAEKKDYIVYNLLLFPENSWMFGSGFGDKDADMTPVYEKIVKWKDHKPTFLKQMILIPATSVKGAIAHRVAFHYNRLTGKFADELKTKEEIQKHVGENNIAVKALFGDDKEQIGRVIFSDVFQENKEQTKVLNHVSIDRFTGGALDTALFNEKVITQKSEIIKLEIYVMRDAFKKDTPQEPKIQKAFEATLIEICNGMLPLGGGVMRGHGIFKGACSCEGRNLI